MSRNLYIVDKTGREPKLLICESKSDFIGVLMDENVDHTFKMSDSVETICEKEFGRYERISRQEAEKAFPEMKKYM